MAKAGAGVTLPEAGVPSKNEARAMPAVAVLAAGFGPCVKAGEKPKVVELSGVCRALNRMRRISAPALTVKFENVLVAELCRAYVSRPKEIRSAPPSVAPVPRLLIDDAVERPVMVMTGNDAMGNCRTVLAGKPSVAGSNPRLNGRLKLDRRDQDPRSVPIRLGENTWVSSATPL